MTVVQDDAAGLVAWLAPETLLLRPVLPDGRELRSVPAVEMFRAERAMRRDRWEGMGVLKVAPTGLPWSVWHFWDEDWAFRGWYVNLEDAHRRDGNSVFTQDHVLDLWVGADRRVRWKDEDELEASVIAGRYSADDADRFQANARAVEGIVQRWEPPFSDGWEDWRPNPSWSLPSLPPAAEWDFDPAEDDGSIAAGTPVGLDSAGTDSAH